MATEEFLDAPDLEVAVLGAMINESYTAAHYALYCRKEYFHNERYRKIFEIIQQLVLDNKTVEVFLIAQKMYEQKMGEVPLCTHELLTLGENVASSVNIGYHIEVLRMTQLRRELWRVGNSLRYDSADGALNADALVEQYLNKLKEIQANRPWQKEVRTQQEVADSACREREERLNRIDEKGLSGISTGIEEMDRLTGGWQPEEIIIIGGQNGDGKSWFMVMHLLAAAMHGAHCLVYSLEMRSELLYGREVMMSTDVNSTDWRQGTTDEKKNAQLQKVRNSLDYLPILYMDNVKYDIDRLCAMARQYNEKGLCDILFIDYAQIIKSMEGMDKDRRTDVIGVICAKLQSLARELHIPVVLLSQLNREPTKRSEGRPQKSDLSESSKLEHVADRIILIWHPYDNGVLEYGKKRLDTRNMIVYYEVKGRHIGKNEYLLRHNKDFTHFYPAD